VNASSAARLARLIGAVTPPSIVNNIGVVTKAGLSGPMRLRHPRAMRAGSEPRADDAGADQESLDDSVRPADHRPRNDGSRLLLS